MHGIEVIRPYTNDGWYIIYNDKKYDKNNFGFEPKEVIDKACEILEATL
jgi:hypothetical protein